MNLAYESPPPVPEKIVQRYHSTAFPEKIVPPERNSMEIPTPESESISIRRAWENIKKWMRSSFKGTRRSEEPDNNTKSSSPANAKNWTSIESIVDTSEIDPTFVVKRYRVPTYGKDVANSPMTVVEYFDIQLEQYKNIPTEEQVTMIVFNGAASDAVGSLNLARQLFDQVNIASSSEEDLQSYTHKGRVTRIIVLPNLAGTSRTNSPDPEMSESFDASAKIMHEALQALEPPLRVNDQLLIYGYSAGASSGVALFDKLSNAGHNPNTISLLLSEPAGLSKIPHGVVWRTFLPQLMAMYTLDQHFRRVSKDSKVPVLTFSAQLDQMLQVWESGRWRGVPAIFRDLVLRALVGKRNELGGLYGLGPDDMAPITPETSKLEKKSVIITKNVKEAEQTTSPRAVAMVWVQASPVLNPGFADLHHNISSMEEFFLGSHLPHSTKLSHHFIANTATHAGGVRPIDSPEVFQMAFRDVLPTVDKH